MPDLSRIKEVFQIYKIGLTGGIATGKTTVANIIRDFGIKTINADELAHKVIEPGTKGYKLVLNEFSPHILKVDGEIDRYKLGELVFSDRTNKLKKLEAIIHPLVLDAMMSQVEMLKQQGQKIVVVEMPLLFEADLGYLFNSVWVVATDPSIQLKRLIKRNGFKIDEAKRRIYSQEPIASKVKKANVVIYNNGDLNNTKLQVETELKKLGVLN